MRSALSNPYEITVDGITCKASPFGGGYYISIRDLNDLGNRSEDFKSALFREYTVEQSRELDGIKVINRREKIDVKADDEEEKRSAKE